MSSLKTELVEKTSRAAAAAKRKEAKEERQRDQRYEASLAREKAETAAIRKKVSLHGGEADRADRELTKLMRHEASLARTSVVINTNRLVQYTLGAGEFGPKRVETMIALEVAVERLRLQGITARYERGSYVDQYDDDGIHTGKGWDYHWSDDLCAGEGDRLTLSWESAANAAK